MSEEKLRTKYGITFALGLIMGVAVGMIYGIAIGSTQDVTVSPTFDHNLTFVIPDYPLASHVKIGILQPDEGGFETEYNYPIEEINQDRTFTHPTNFDAKWLFVVCKYYRESGSGFILVGEINFRVEYP